MKQRLGIIDWFSYAAYLALLAVAVKTGIRTPLWYFGLAMSVVCAILWFIARWQLGSSFSVGAEAKHLVTSGLYSKIRHPIYVFGTMSFMWAVLALLGLPALVIWAVILGVQAVRSRKEDRVLAEAFGEEYAAYRQTTWL